MHQKILIIDFGSQYTQLIARRIRELNVYCEIHPFHHLPQLTADTKGVVLSGSPSSVREAGSPRIDLSSIRSKVPVLGVCYGAQLLAHENGGEVIPSKIREYGRATLNTVEAASELFRNIAKDSTVWMSHGDTIANVPESFDIIASTGDVRVAAYKIRNESTFGIQFQIGRAHV